LFDVHHRQARGAVVALAAEAQALAAVGLLAWSGRLGLAAVGAVFATKWSLSAAAQFVVYHCSVRRLRWVIAGDEIRLLLRSGWPLLVGALASLVPVNSGIFFVEALRGPTETALYGLACQAASVFLGFAWLGLRILQPHISGPHGLGRSFLRKLALFAVGSLATLAVLGFLAGTLFIRLVLGPAYLGAVRPMGLLLAASFVIGLSGVVQLYLTRFCEERFQMVVYCGTALLYALACPVVVPRWGPAGAAAATLALAIFATVLNVMRARGKWPDAACATHDAPVGSTAAVTGDGARAPR
jgi:O-antigen/teichoic acid export membrane protein